jgi:heterodisulfide reductase subunit B
MPRETAVQTLNLAALIEERCGENVYLCYQCKKCTAGCPVVEYMDLTPNQLLRAVQLGRNERVLRSRTIWICANCQTCVTRCPHGIDLPRAMDVIKQVATEMGIRPAIASIPIFNQAALRGIQLFGRMFELGLLGELKLRTLLKGDVDLGQLLKDGRMGIRLFLSGKLKILPERGRIPRDLSRVEPRATPGAVAYYPGCSLHSTAKEYDRSTRAVSERIGLRLEEPEGWTCCGTTPAHAVSHHLATRLPLENLAYIERLGYDEVAVPCAACFSRFKFALYDIARYPELREEVTRELGYAYQGKVKVNHIVTTMLERVGTEEIARRIVRPLTDLRVVCYYGCLITRPKTVTGAEHHEYPMEMDRLMAALGAEVLDWNYKTDCCGNNLTLTETEVALKLTQRILHDAKAVGAEAVVVACPLCQVNLDARQPQIAADFQEDLNLPVLYYTQLMGIALGIDPKELHLDTHFVDPKPLLHSKGLLP